MNRRTLLKGVAQVAVIAASAHGLSASVLAAQPPAVAQAGAATPVAPNFAYAPGSPIEEILKDIPLPRMVSIRQTFDRPTLADPIGTFRDNLKASGVLKAVKPGMVVAVGGGSRGITNLPQITKALLDELKAAGAKPFIFPAMGSHGGATPKGQLAVLERMGFTEQAMGVPFQATMDVVEVGRTPGGLPAYMDAIAAKADGIVVVNRIKPHTQFRAGIESGLLKMIVIGVGKQKGAETCHNLGYERMGENLLALGRTAIDTGKILFGVGLIENAYHETCAVPVLPAKDILDKEPELLAAARKLMPQLAVNKLDVLVVDEIGKNISGSGFDPNLVGRYSAGGVQLAAEDPHITRLVVLDITDKSEGNGAGLGVADCSTQKAFKKFNFSETYPNQLTSNTIASSKLPMILANDRQAIQVGVKTCLIGDPHQVRLGRIKNTLSAEHMEISENLLAEVKANPKIQILGEPKPFSFKPDGNLG